ncbi:MAG TPA: VOC family protein [Gemmatimonadales bacterium]|nr:VOC family protein [Gemmatimonadales bacterium]
MTAAAPGLERVVQLALTVRDLPRAVAFYRDVLGLPFLFDAPPQMAFFECGGIRLLIGAGHAGPPAPSGSVVYFATHDIQASHAALAAAGVAFAQPPQRIARLPTSDVWLAEFDDPDGNHLALMSEVPR